MSTWQSARVVGPNAKDIWSWAVTSVGRVAIEGEAQDRVHIPHSKAGHWPVIAPDGVEVEGNPWLVASVNGEWLTATWEWLKPGQVRKTCGPSEFAAKIKAPEFAGWSAEGQVVGFFVSAIARMNHRTVAERSNVTWWDYARRQAVNGPPDENPPPPPSDDLEARVAELEARVARLETRFRGAGEVMVGL